MMSRPPASFERFVAPFIPSGCREEVLGDLSEKYRSPLQYFFLAARTIPFVIVGCFRRNANSVFLLTDPVLIYGAFFFEVWYGGALPHRDSAAFLGLLLPAAITWLYLLARDAFAPAPGKPAPIEPATLAIIVVFMGMTGSPAWLNGFFSAWILVSLTRLLLPFQANPHRTQFMSSPRFNRSASVLFLGPWVLLHFPGILWNIGAAIFAVVLGYGLIKRFVSGPDSWRGPL